MHLDSQKFRTRRLLAILVVADLFHPVHILAVKLFLKGGVRHSCRGCSSVPVFHSWRNLNHITGSDFLNWSAPLLDISRASRHNQGLPQRMGMPCGPRTRLKRDPSTRRTCRLTRLEQGVDADGTCKVFGWSFSGGLRTVSPNLYCLCVIAQWGLCLFHRGETRSKQRR